MILNTSSKQPNGRYICTHLWFGLVLGIMSFSKFEPHHALNAGLSELTSILRNSEMGGKDIICKFDK